MANNPVTLEAALQLMFSSVQPLGVHEASFLDAIGSVLAENIIADMDMPPFHRAAVDGFACRAADIKQELRLIETIAAGYVPQKQITPGECSRIMTGAVVPEGADVILMVEDCEVSDSNTVRYLKDETKSNISLRAEEIRSGEILVPAGTHLSVRHIPTLASAGRTTVTVSRKPKIAIISTGDELVEPEYKPAPAQIRNSNAYAMSAQLRERNLETVYLGIASDDMIQLNKKMVEAEKIADIIIFSGAVSMGDFDFVPEVLRQNGVNILFHGLYAKPGQKTIFGKKGKQWYFGVPGNPVSSFVQMEFLLMPFLKKLMGGDPEAARQFKLPVGFDYKRKKGRNKEFLPVKIHKDGYLEQIAYRGSGHIHAVSQADAFMILERDVLEIRKGEWADVRPI